MKAKAFLMVMVWFVGYMLTKLLDAVGAKRPGRQALHHLLVDVLPKAWPRPDPNDPGAVRKWRRDMTAHRRDYRAAFLQERPTWRLALKLPGELGNVVIRYVHQPSGVVALMCAALFFPTTGLAVSYFLHEQPLNGGPEVLTSIACVCGLVATRDSAVRRRVRVGALATAALFSILLGTEVAFAFGDLPDRFSAASLLVGGAGVAGLALAIGTSARWIERMGAILAALGFGALGVNDAVLPYIAGIQIVASSLLIMSGVFCILLSGAFLLVALDKRSLMLPPAAGEGGPNPIAAPGR